MYLTRSSAQAKPPSVTSHRSLPFGGSPRRATMLQMPASLAPARPASHTSLDWLVQVRCMLAITPCCSCDFLERSSVKSEVEPPAPQVKSINMGFCFTISAMTPCSLATPSSVRGGKYSKEMNGWSVTAVHALTMSMILPFLITGSTPRLSVPLPDTSAASVAAEARYESDMEEDPRVRGDL
eukprot:scaffold4840_cov115-Isochrysis_galbana.AAC.18